MNYPRFIIFRNEDGLFYYELFIDREKLLLTGIPRQEYTQCTDDIRQLYAHAQKEHHYRMQAAHGWYYFQVTNAQYKVVGNSRIYRSMSDLVYGLNHVKQNVPVAVIIDHSIDIRQQLTTGDLIRRN